MALSNYGELKAEIAEYLARSDLTGSIPTFVTLCEARINYGSGEPGDALHTPPLRIRQMQQVDESLTLSAGTAALPTGFLEMRSAYIDQPTDTQLDYIPEDQLRRKYDSSASGVPRLYSIEGTNLLVWPAPDDTYTAKITYWKAFDAFSSDSDTNWLLTNAPGVYLYGALIESAPYLNDPKRLQEWFSLFKGAIGGLTASDARSRHPAASLQAIPIATTW